MDFACSRKWSVMLGAHSQGCLVVVLVGGEEEREERTMLRSCGGGWVAVTLATRERESTVVSMVMFRVLGGCGWSRVVIREGLAPAAALRASSVTGVGSN